jgi:hypothetical protein
MSRVRAYLSECLLWAVRKTQLEIPIPPQNLQSVAILRKIGMTPARSETGRDWYRIKKSDYRTPD